MMMMVAFPAILLLWLGGIAPAAAASIATASTSSSVITSLRPLSADNNDEDQQQQQQDQHRDLVWNEDAKWCSTDKIFRLQTYVDPTIFQCSFLMVNWDGDGILSARGELYIGKTPDGRNNPTTTWTAEYLKTRDTQDVELTCTGFGQCGPNLAPASSGVTPGQYWYDCTNVYCGPQASRDCTGRYQDNSASCPAGVLVADDPDLRPIIPTLQSISCDYFHSYLETTEYADTCSACVASSGGAGTSITCPPRNVNGDNGLLTLDERFDFTELQRSDVECVTSTSPSSQRVCLTKTAPVLYGAYANIDQFTCATTVDGASCNSCTICGHTDDARNAQFNRYTSVDLLYRVDCINLDGISQYNACDGTITGLFVPLTSALVVKQGVPTAPSPPITTAIPPPPPVSAPMVMPVAVFPTLPTTSATAPIPAPVSLPVPVPVPVAAAPFGWPLAGGTGGSPFTWLTPVAATVPAAGGGGTPLAAPVAVVAPVVVVPATIPSDDGGSPPVMPVVAATVTTVDEVVGTAPTGPPGGVVVVPPSPVNVVGQTIQASSQSRSSSEMAYAKRFSVVGVLLVSLIVPTLFLGY
jgi:hypothetical protein